VHPSNIVNLNISVGGDKIAKYQFKLGPSLSTFCNVALDYGPETLVSSNIVMNLAALSDGLYTICVRGQTKEGLIQSIDSATSYTWLKDTKPPTAMANGAPLGTSISTQLSIQVLGLSATLDSNVTNYRYKIGESGTTSCGDNLNFSNVVPVSSLINEDISALGNGGITLCLVGADAALNWQPFNMATKISWAKGLFSAPEPFAILNGLPSSTDSQTTLAITVGGLSVTHYQYKIGLRSLTECSDPNGYSIEFVASTNIQDDISSFSNGSNLKICVIGGESGGAYQSYAHATTYSWIKDTVVFVNFASMGSSFTDSSQKMSFEISLSQPKSYDVVINYSVYGTAIYNLDHDLSSGSVLIPAGTTSATLSYNLIRNPVVNSVPSERSLNLKITKSDREGVVVGPLSYLLNSIKDAESVYSTIIDATESCALRQDGKLFCWGLNEHGQVGDGTIVSKTVPVQIDSGTLYSKISSSGANRCGITSGGVLKCWGYNIVGQVGDNSTTDRSVPTLIDSGTLYASVSVANEHACGITTSGVLKCWGYNYLGRIGDGTTVNKLVPTIIDSGTTYSQVKAGPHSTCGITSINQVKCWGSNSYGQVGNGTTSTAQASPVLIDSSTTYSQIVLGAEHTCGITTSGVLKCWGKNSLGQVGDNTTSDKLVPTIIDPGISYSKIQLGYGRTCGISSAGIFKCWGNNTYSRNGYDPLTFVNGNIPNTIDSGTTYTNLSLSIYHTCGITSDSSLKCWGSNSNGQLGRGVIEGESGIPTIVDTGTTYSKVLADRYHTCGITTQGYLKCWGRPETNSSYAANETIEFPAPVPIAPELKFSKISLRYYRSCGISDGGKLYCWGSQQSAIGDGSNLDRLTPVEIDKDTYYSNISIGEWHTCGITAGGDLKCWGSNWSGQLGIGTVDEGKVFPTIIDSGTKYISVGTGSDHTCGVTTSGILKCWGANWNKQLGIAGGDKSAPTEIDTGVAYNSVVTGDDHNCGVTSTGVLKCWGANWNGEVGDGSTGSVATPVIVDAGTQYKRISLSYSSTCGITNSNIFKCWGDNGSGNFGDGTTVSQLIPTAIATGINFDKIQTGSMSTCGIDTNSNLYCWGNNTYGILGDNTKVSKLIPTLVNSSSSFSEVSIGKNYACAVTNLNELKCWGYNEFGQLGLDLDQWIPDELPHFIFNLSGQ
jgi:alpha-tubulin suppressor-like RCC1 family protein